MTRTRPTSTNAPTAEPLDRLAQAVLAARTAQGLTQDQVAERGGIAALTLRGIEKGKKAPRHFTLARLEAGLGWPAGTAQKVLDGGEAPSSAAPQPTGTLTLDERVDRLEARVEHLMRQLDAAATLLSRRGAP